MCALLKTYGRCAHLQFFIDIVKGPRRLRRDMWNSSYTLKVEGSAPPLLTNLILFRRGIIYFHFYVKCDRSDNFYTKDLNFFFQWLAKSWNCLELQLHISWHCDGNRRTYQYDVLINFHTSLISYNNFK